MDGCGRPLTADNVIGEEIARNIGDERMFGPDRPGPRLSGEPVRGMDMGRFGDFGRGGGGRAGRNSEICWLGNGRNRPRCGREIALFRGHAAQ